MKIRVKKKRRVASLIMGLLWAALSAMKILYGSFDDWSDYAITLLALFFVIDYTNRVLTPYVSVKNGQITTNNIFTPTLKLSEVTEIKEFAGDITLHTPDKKLTINTDLLDEQAVEEFRSLINKRTPDQNQ